MNTYAIICTRTTHLGVVTKILVEKLSSFGVDVKVLANSDSIFKAYKKGFDLCKPDKNDIVIFCHDDIQLLQDQDDFFASLTKCVEEDTGIVGPAGTTALNADAVWWRQDLWEKGYHRGQVKHRKEVQKGNESVPVIEKTHYGDFGQVVALDGLFLAARAEVWERVGLDKPDYFEGDWDFYDIHYTVTAHQLGLKNYAVPVDMIHLSVGELVGRDSWHKNREAFIKQHELPILV
jgi:GT2 family glycosyltransferase|tara:strand:+ start:544 stop:1245 length:702 start_codon:yes stop_codon:yes gene_type:complete